MDTVVHVLTVVLLVLAMAFTFFAIKKWDLISDLTGVDRLTAPATYESNRSSATTFTVLAVVMWIGVILLW